MPAATLAIDDLLGLEIPGESRAGRDRDGIDLRDIALADFEYAIEQRQNTANVVARCQFGDHAAIGHVHIDLRVQLLSEQSLFAIEQGKPGLVARSFNSQNQHGLSVGPVFPLIARQPKGCRARKIG